MPPTADTKLNQSRVQTRDWWVTEDAGKVPKEPQLNAALKHAVDDRLPHTCIDVSKHVHLRSQAARRCLFIALQFTIFAMRAVPASDRLPNIADSVAGH